MLSPGYLDFMTKSVGMILAGSVFTPIRPVESNHLIMVALYMSRDAEARELFLQGLEDFGEYVIKCWNQMYTMVTESNQAGQKAAQDNINAILERIKQQ